MKSTAKAAKKTAPAKKTTAAKKAAPPPKTAPAKKVTVVKKTATVTKEKVNKTPVAKKAVSTPKAAPTPKPMASKKMAETKPVAALAQPVEATPKATKGRAKGPDKNYVAPPTAVVVQTSAKLVHTPVSAGSMLNPAVIPAPVKKNQKLANNWKDKAPEELTDAEVIAMPDEEYMNKAQLAFFKNRLVQLRDSVLLNATETTEHLRDDTVVVPDPTDRATIEEEHALELRTRDRERKLLKKIQQSIARIDQEDYGYCDETGEPIGVSRLIARPTASLSLEAQQRRELKQKMFGD